MQTKHPHLSFRAWSVWGLCALFYFYELLIQVSPSVIATDLMASFPGMTAGTLGLLGSVYFWTYSSIQLPVGFLIDKMGVRKLLTFATFFCSISCYLFAHTHLVWALLLARAIIGFGSAFAIIGCAKIITTWFPPSLFALVFGLTVTIGSLGAILGESALAYTVEQFGWRDSMAYLGLTGIILTILIAIFVRDYAENNPAPKQNSTISGLYDGLKNVTSKTHNWLVAIYAGLMFTPTLAFAALWGGPYFMQAYHLPRTDAANILALIFVGWAIGSPLLGRLSDKIQRRKPIMIFSSVAALILMSLMIYAHDLNLWQLQSLAFAYGFSYSGFLLAFSVSKETNSLAISATTFGFMNMLNNLGGAALQPIIGLILDKTWDGTLVNNTPLYSLENYHVALSIIPIVLAASIGVIPFIRETYCRQQVD